MDSRLDFESERVSPVFFGEVGLGSKPGLSLTATARTGTRQGAGSANNIREPSAIVEEQQAEAVSH